MSRTLAALNNRIGGRAWGDWRQSAALSSYEVLKERDDWIREAFPIDRELTDEDFDL